MKIKKNKFVIFYLFNIFLLLLILGLAIPISKYLSKIDLKDNEFVTGQVVINPDAKSPEIINRNIKINFVAKVDSLLEWDFKVLQEVVNLKIGEKKVINYEGKNNSQRIITSTANFIASPKSIFPYLIKTECFCFTEQTLNPGESTVFTLIFYIDPALDSDSKLDDLKEVVFTYEFSEYKS